MNYHINIKVSTALDMIRCNKNPFDSSDNEAMAAMLKAQSEGKTHYSGCENMAGTGQCLGHEEI